MVRQKFTILDRNFHCHWGELDFVAKKDGKIVFVEVKTRVGLKKGKPYEAVNYYKLKGLKRAIDYYLLQKKLSNCKLSLDVISIVLGTDYQVRELKHFQNILW